MKSFEILSSSGFVSIIGAGPGDPELITVKGMDRLRRADVVLYDRLVAPQLLDEINPMSEAIDVGKAPAKQRFPQSEINALLIEKARLGKHVARLKGGDPFVFGRGGEECQVLAEAGISYEVIPGVSSAIAVPAYAGIPVTHRGITTTFTVIAGHTGEPESGIDWVAISKSGTLVFLMGVAHLHEIRSQLLTHGMSGDMPVAVIQSGATAEQIVVIGTLENILEKTHDISPPATIVIGQVVNLRQQIAWFDEPCKVIPFVLT
jgi:uroporphyrin-III C-methyltransferase